MSAADKIAEAPAALEELLEQRRDYRIAADNADKKGDRAKAWFFRFMARGLDDVIAERIAMENPQ